MRPHATSRSDLDLLSTHVSFANQGLSKRRGRSKMDVLMMRLCIRRLLCIEKARDVNYFRVLVEVRGNWESNMCISYYRRP